MAQERKDEWTQQEDVPGELFAAHTRETPQGLEYQGLRVHLLGTQERCRQFGEAFGNGDFAARCGLLHDVGKYSQAFQKRIRNTGPRCDHATAGAKLAFAASPPFGKLAAYCVAGHHSGLLDCGSRADTGGEGTLWGRLSEEYGEALPDYSAYARELDLSALALQPKEVQAADGRGGFTFAFFTHMIYSCLTDADFLDTECFMSGGREREMPAVSFEKMWELLEARLRSLASAVTLVNRKRGEVLERCLASAQGERGLYRLAVPTGGGKTLSSMAFALRHLLKNEGLRRIIYVIPYTSIIEQNAKEFADVFGREVVLEHHANYDFERDEDALRQSKHLATENWDMPVVVTTNVQFFESLFSNKSSKNRKLHNIANSVIIFDEVQMLPTRFLKPCVSAIAELVRNYRCTAVLCSATQPALDNLFPANMPIEEICDDLNDLFLPFKRVAFADLGVMQNEALAERIQAGEQSLTIVNTRKQARRLYALLKGEGCFHLSTYMCPAHRRAVLDKIRLRLKNHLPCRVVSTSLVEAGVDLDFPVVYRALCGLDSLVQAAGRCNREGRLCDAQGNSVLGEVFLFTPDAGEEKLPAYLHLPVAATQEVMRLYDDLLMPEAIKAYFSLLYASKDSGTLTGVGGSGLDEKNIFERLEAGMPHGKKTLESTFEYPFASVAEDFQLIDSTASVIVPFDEKARELIEKLPYAKGKEQNGLMRALQGYTVSVYLREFYELDKARRIELVDEQVAVLRNGEDYDDRCGLIVASANGSAQFL